MTKHFALLLAGLVPVPAAMAVSSDPSQAGVEFFEKKIRPVLAEYCHKCHSHKAEKLKAGLYLDSREGFLKGGDTGVAVALGEPDKSRLIEAIRYKNPELEMPPKEKLPDEVIADFVEWVKLGIPWPKEETAAAPATSPDKSKEIEKRKREHWAWQPVRQYQPPPVQNKTWPKNGIDRFVLAGLEKKSLTPVSPADRRTLIRRAYFDLIGLPPTAGEIAAFEQDRSPDAFAKVVDSLLANPHYGERWGRHWLDVARYGEDQAHSFKPRLYPQGFRYRDWLVPAFNEDMPYDRFITRSIMLSSTYQMSSRDDAHNQTVDADNKSLWRMNRRRLEVEAWRDAMLTVSGELDPTIGGESQELSPENRRRTFYARVSRHNLDSLLRLFDFPDPNVTSDARTVTTVPLQQLFFLNSEFMVRQAKTLAAKLTASANESDDQRIEKAFLLVYGRRPTKEEVQLGQEFLARPQESTSGNSGSLSRWDQYAQVLLSANEFLFVD